MHHPQVSHIVNALKGKMHSPNSGTCFCPAHKNTRTPALSVSMSHDCKLLLKCHAGCEFIDVLQALKEKGLIDNSDYNTPRDVIPPDWNTPHENTEHQKAFIQKTINECISARHTLVQEYLYVRGILCV